MKTRVWAPSLMAIVCALPLLPAEPSSTGDAPAGWDAKAAARYLDDRMNWWMKWPVSARDHDTFCVSCHTVLPYALSRSGLRKTLKENGPPPAESELLANVTKRVRLWAEVQPFYSEKTSGPLKTVESRGTESILNAVILVRAAPGAPLSEDAKLALDHMWSEQLQSGDSAGVFTWLQFHNSPWEGDSQYFGATLAAIAVGSAPASYRSAPEVRQHLTALTAYLRSHCEGQILFHRVMLLWASTELPDLLTSKEQKLVIDEASSKQQADGGWSLSSLVGGWKRRDGTPLETKSDGYATGLDAYVMQQAGMPANDKCVERALAWLKRNQDRTEGRWLAYSLNKNRDLASDVGRFMSDAATSYAVLALQAEER